MLGNVLAGSRAGLYHHIIYRFHMVDNTCRYVARECKDVRVQDNDFSGCKSTKHDACPGLPGLVIETNK